MKDVYWLIPALIVILSIILIILMIATAVGYENPIETKRRLDYISTCQSEMEYTERQCIWMYDHR